MGILKIELEVPEFKEAIELSLILKKDGEVIASSSSLDKDSEKPIWKQDMPLGPGTLYPKPNLDRKSDISNMGVFPTSRQEMSSSYNLIAYFPLS